MRLQWCTKGWLRLHVRSPNFERATRLAIQQLADTVLEPFVLDKLEEMAVDKWRLNFAIELPAHVLTTIVTSMTNLFARNQARQWNWPVSRHGTTHGTSGIQRAGCVTIQPSGFSPLASVPWLQFGSGHVLQHGGTNDPRFQGGCTSISQRYVVFTVSTSLIFAARRPAAIDLEKNQANHQANHTNTHKRRPPHRNTHAVAGRNSRS